MESEDDRRNDDYLNDYYLSLDNIQYDLLIRSDFMIYHLSPDILISFYFLNKDFRYYVTNAEVLNKLYKINLNGSEVESRDLNLPFYVKSYDLKFGTIRSKAVDLYLYDITFNRYNTSKETLISALRFGCTGLLVAILEANNRKQRAEEARLRSLILSGQYRTSNVYLLDVSLTPSDMIFAVWSGLYDIFT